MNIWSRIGRRILSPVCVLCGATAEGPFDLCRACNADLPYIRGACHRCGVPLPTRAEVCGRCLQRPPAYDSLLAPFLYTPPISALITGLKFQNRLHYARLLGELLGQSIGAGAARPDCLLPVPLHPARLRQRGFNQALEIARPLAERLQIRLDIVSLQRSRATDMQSGLPAERRRANVRNAFQFVDSHPAAHVAIIDDVVTTGHTVEEMAHVLRRAGVKRVEVWAIARAVPH